MIQVGIVGGTGYAGAELLRLLAMHPDFRLRAVTSRAAAGKAVAEHFPQLQGRLDLAFSAPGAEALAGCEVVFFATPGGVAMQSVPALRKRDLRVIDLSADFRLKDPALYPQWYGREHAAPELLAEAVYGLPEVNRAAIRSAGLVAGPGCYPTAVQLALLPLLEGGYADAQQIIADCKSGISGAGRKFKSASMYAEAADNLSAYAVAGHRHQPEIEQGLAAMAGSSVGLTFVPHLVPMLRGLHATVYARVAADVDLQKLYEQRYADEPFVDVLPAGTHPQTRSVRGSNHCQISVHRPPAGQPAVILAAIDNLTKGAAGQAVQCANLMCGLDETAGLNGIALSP